ncbi:MAG: tetratricopeptide repeat protein [Chloroflexi bacterium]|nr:tetratricopeptide repeat protein [Chloroflexota bacterium]
MEAPDEQQARSLSERAFRFRMMGALREARELYLRSLEQWRALGNQRGAAEALQKLGEIEMDFQRAEEAEAYLRESAALWERLGEWESCADCLRKLGRMARGQGRHAAAEAIQRERWRAMELSRLQWEDSARRGEPGR